MTTTTHRRTVAEMERRLADARQMMQSLAADRRADAERLGHRDGAFDHGAACGYEGALQLLTACFDDPDRDWMYQR